MAIRQRHYASGRIAYTVNLISRLNTNGKLSQKKKKRTTKEKIKKNKSRIDTDLWLFFFFAGPCLGSSKQSDTGRCARLSVFEGRERKEEEKKTNGLQGNIPPGKKIHVRKQHQKYVFFFF